MLILVAVTISMAVNGGLFDYAGKAVGDTKNAMDAEQQLSNGAIKVDGVWYDSIDDYINKKPSTNQGEGDTGGDESEEGPVKITLSIAGTKVTEVPLPSTEFEHVEGTIETGYVIKHKTDGNEFVWVPVDKNQKITLKVTSESDVTELKLYDPYGDLILTVADGEIQNTYNNTEINPTVNGMYMAVATTEEGITQETLTVKSLYALDTMNDWYTTDEFAETQGAGNIEELVLAMGSQMGFSDIESALNYLNAPTIEVAISMVNTLQGFYWKNYTDLVDYSENVNTNGGFYIAKYEAGVTTVRTSGSDTATVAEIITANGKPVSKEGYAPYNNITHAQAKGLAESMYESNDNYTVSLLTGSAWDRTLGWIQETGSKSVQEIAYDSTSWGNYRNAEFDITKGKYSGNDGQTYQEVSGTYTKANENDILLTTGARNETQLTPRNFANNIFDLAGNVEEWTNEAGLSGGLVIRGSGYPYHGGNDPASLRGYNDSDYFYFSLSFRAALYLK